MTQASYAAQATPLEALAAPTTARVEYLDVLRALAIVAVLIVHVASPVCFALNGVSPTSWWIANALNSATHWCVPAFVMVSGALLLNSSRDESPRRFYSRRISRIGIPLVFWSAFYLFWQRIYAGDPITLRRTASDLLWGQPYYHLYFLFLISGLYLFTPMLRVLIRSIPRRHCVLMTALILAMACMSFLLRRPHNLWRDTSADVFVPYLGYYLAGFLIANWATSKRWLPMAYTAATLLIAGAIAGVGWCKATGRTDVWPAMFQGYFSPITVIVSLSIFLIAKHHAGKLTGLSWASNTITTVASASLGIYLIHPIFLDIVLKRAGHWLTHPSAGVGVPLCSALLLVTSLAATQLLASIPGVRRIVG
jgi:surface polysaccharide O-acyltransferase-like enzyme